MCQELEISYIVIALTGTILIPVIVAIENWIFRTKQDCRERNRQIYFDKFGYTYNQLFNEEKEYNKTDSSLIYISETNNFNIQLIFKFISEIKEFREYKNKFKSCNVNKHFKKLLKSALQYEQFVEPYSNKNSSEYKEEVYKNKEIENLKNDFIKFYKSIFDAI